MLLFLGSWLVYIYNEYFRSGDAETSADESMALMQVVRQQARSASLCFKVMSEGGGFRTTECHTAAGWLQRFVGQTATAHLSVIDPKVHVDLKEWTSYINQQDHPEISSSEEDGKVYVLIRALTDQREAGTLASAPNTVKVTDHMTPLAWKSGENFSVVGECSLEGLLHLSNAFLRNQLILEETSLTLDEMITVSLEGHAVKLLRTDSSASEPFPNQSSSGSKVNSEQGSGECSLIQEEEHPAAKSEYVRPQFNVCSDEELQVEFKREQNGIQVPTKFAIGDEEESCQNGGDFGVDSEGAGEALSPREEVSSAFGMDDSEASNSPVHRPESSSDDVLNSGAGEALSPQVDERGLFRDFEKLHTSSKPPNVLVYCGKKDSQRLFETVKGTFSLCFNPDKYILYNLKHEQIFRDPWVDNTACLVIASDKIYDGIEKEFLRYFLHGGVVCSFVNNVDLLFCDRSPQQHFSGILKLRYKSWDDVTVTCGKHSYGQGPFTSKLGDVELMPVGYDNTGNVVILLAYHRPSGGRAILSQCNLDKDPTEMAITPHVFHLLKHANARRFEVLRDLLAEVGVDSRAGKAPTLTPCFLLASNENLKKDLRKSLGPRLKDGILPSRELKVQFLHSASDVIQPVAKDILPVVTATEHALGFNSEAYFGELRSRVLGNTVLYTEVITSTMPLVESLMCSMPENVGLIAIAKQQTLGKGRGGNAWLSPAGCAMFSVHVTLTLDTELGSRLSYLQHIASLAVVEAVTTIPGYEELDIRLKWPNDLYYGERIKIGGVLVKSSIMANTVHADIGVGVNVTNNNPTMCINDAVRRYNQDHVTQLDMLTTEVVIARAVTRLEQLVHLFQDGGCEAFLPRYYSRWIHSGKMVQLESESGPEATVEGLDAYGYLLVSLADGSRHSVHPDGNSYDITKNLILPKTERT